MRPAHARGQAKRALQRHAGKLPPGRAFSYARRPVAAQRLVVSSAHPVRQAAGPLGSCPVSWPHPRHMAGACCSENCLTHTHTHTRGLWAPQVWCALSLRGSLLVHSRPRAPLAGACRALLRSPHVPSALNVLCGHCIGFVRLAGAARGVVRPRHRKTGRGSLVMGRRRQLEPHRGQHGFGCGLSRRWQASHGVWKGAATPKGPWAPSFRRGARSHRRCAFSPPPAGDIWATCTHPGTWKTPLVPGVWSPTHPTALGCVEAGKAGHTEFRACGCCYCSLRMRQRRR